MDQHQGRVIYPSTILKQEQNLEFDILGQNNVTQRKQCLLNTAKIRFRFSEGGGVTVRLVENRLFRNSTWLTDKSCYTTPKDRLIFFNFFKLKFTYPRVFFQRFKSIVSIFTFNFTFTRNVVGFSSQNFKYLFMNYKWNYG